jgi:hypothetical protein
MPPVCSKKVVPMELTREITIDTGNCETCAERGRPHEPVYKMGMCEFCYNDLPHPKATRKQLAKERAGSRYGMHDGEKPVLSRTIRPILGSPLALPLPDPEGFSG